MNFVPPQEKTVTLGLAGTFVDVDVSAQFVACVECSEGFKIAINDGSPFRFNKGLFLSLPFADIRKIRVSTLDTVSIASNPVTLLFGVGEFRDSRWNVVSGSSIQTRGAATLNTAVADVTLTAATNTLLFAGNSLRRCVRIRNTGTADVRLSSDNADLTAGRGELLRPSEVLELFVTGGIWARSASTPTLVISQELYSA